MKSSAKIQDSSKPNDAQNRDQEFAKLDVEFLGNQVESAEDLKRLNKNVNRSKFYSRNRAEVVSMDQGIIHEKMSPDSARSVLTKIRNGEIGIEDKLDETQYSTSPPMLTEELHDFGANTLFSPTSEDVKVFHDNSHQLQHNDELDTDVRGEVDDFHDSGIILGTNEIKKSKKKSEQDTFSPHTYDSFASLDQIEGTKQNVGTYIENPFPVKENHDNEFQLQNGNVDSFSHDTNSFDQRSEIFSVGGSVVSSSAATFALQNLTGKAHTSLTTNSIENSLSHDTTRSQSHTEAQIHSISKNKTSNKSESNEAKAVKTNKKVVEKRRKKAQQVAESTNPALPIATETSTNPALSVPTQDNDTPNNLQYEENGEGISTMAGKKDKKKARGLFKVKSLIRRSVSFFFLTSPFNNIFPSVTHYIYLFFAIHYMQIQLERLPIVQSQTKHPRISIRENTRQKLLSISQS